MGGDWSGFRFFLALEVMRRLRVYSTKVGRSPHREGSSGVPLDRCRSTSAMFCIDVSSRPPSSRRASPVSTGSRASRGRRPSGTTASPRESCRGRCRGRWCWRGTRSRRFLVHRRVVDAVLLQHGVLDVGYPVRVLDVARLLVLDRRSTSTLTPSLAPRWRSQLAKPSALSSLAPTPASARIVVSVPAIGLVICRTVAPLRPLASSQVNTPWSCISFQIAPWPPGLRATLRSSPPSVTHCPPRVVTTGTKGCSKSLKEFSPRPKKFFWDISVDMRRWLPLAADVITATGVTC